MAFRARKVFLTFAKRAPDLQIALIFLWLGRFGSIEQFPNDYAIAIATISDWLKNLAAVFQPMRSRTKTNRTLFARFFPSCVQVVASV